MSDARSLTLALHGKWHGRYGLACCPAHGDRRPSLTLANAPGGRLLLSCKSGCSFLDVLNALRRQGLVDRDRPFKPPDPTELARHRAQEESEAGRREKQAREVWRRSLSGHCTLTEIYLRNRGITCSLPESLRFHPACWHGATAQRLPAMVARVDGLPRMAVHRTYLREDGTGKADVEPAKAMLGATLGGFVRVADAEGPLVVAEGIETALSVRCLMNKPATVWATLSAPGMAGLRLPQRPGALVVAPDGDAAGRNAAHTLVRTARTAGWQVLWRDPGDGADWNDILQEGNAA